MKKLILFSLVIGLTTGMVFAKGTTVSVDQFVGSSDIRMSRASAGVTSLMTDGDVTSTSNSLNGNRDITQLKANSVLPKKAKKGKPINHRPAAQNNDRQGGEDCANATVIATLPYTDSGSTLGANDDYDFACPVVAAAGDVVYSYTPAADETIVINLCLGTTNYDTKVFVYANECTSGNEVGCNDDACSSPYYAYSYVSSLTLDVTAGTEYFIVVDGCDYFGGISEGNYTIEVTAVALEDECPVDTFFGHPIETVNWTAVNSEASEDLICFDNFAGLDADVCDLHWWGITVYNDGVSWSECADDPMDFEVKFYPDDGMGQPDLINPACTYNLTLTATDSLIEYAGFTVWMWNTTLSPCCDISEGWISIQGTTDNSCWFLWANSHDGDFIDGISWQLDSSSATPEWTQNDFDMSFCLTNSSLTTGACCDPAYGTCSAAVDEATCLAMYGGTGVWKPGLTCNPNPCALPPPDNDDCVNAEQILTPYPQEVSGTTLGATVDCPGVLNWDAVWYKFDVTAIANTVTIEYCKTLEDIATVGIVLYPEPTDPLVACPEECLGYILVDDYSYDQCGVDSRPKLRWNALPSGTYYYPAYVAKSGDLPMDFIFDINVQPYFSGPANDDCVDAEQIPSPYPQTVTGTCDLASVDCPGVLDVGAVWYKFDVAATSNMELDFCGTSQDIYNIVAVLYDEPANPGVACPDDCSIYHAFTTGGFLDCGDGTVNPTLRWYNLPAGTYYMPIRAEDYYGWPLDFEFTINVEEVTCDVTCPTGGTVEAEPCGDLVNDGCYLDASAPPVVPVTCGEDFCGVLFADSTDPDIYDADFLQLTLASTQKVTWTVESEIPVYCVLTKADCSDLIVYGDGVTGQCEPLAIEANLPAGAYFLWIEPSDEFGTIADDFPCLPTEFEYTSNVICEPPCEVTCPVGGTPEGETCGDATNDGCNVDPNAFGAIACEEIICGNVYADASLRDTDWYEFTLTEAQTVTLTVQGEIPMAALIVSGDCSAPVVEAGEVGDTCEVFSASAVLPAGTYYAFVAPSVYYGYPCATGPWDYTAELTCDELAVPATGPFGLGLLLLAISGILGFRIRRKK